MEDIMQRQSLLTARSDCANVGLVATGHINASVLEAVGNGPVLLRRKGGQR